MVWDSNMSKEEGFRVFQFIRSWVDGRMIDEQVGGSRWMEEEVGQWMDK